MKQLMIGFSTENNIINVIPALLVKLDELLLITSKRALENNWNKGIKIICERRGIKFNEKILAESDSFLNGIHIALAEIKSDYRNYEIFLNVTGGQKNFSIASTLFIENNDKLLYFDGNKEGLFIIGDKEEKFLTCDSIENPLNLTEIFLLKGIQVGRISKVYGKEKSKLVDRQEIRKLSKDFLSGQNIQLFYEKNFKNLDKSKLAFLGGLEEYILKGKGLLNVLEVQFIEKQIKEMKKYFKVDKLNVTQKSTLDNVRRIFEKSLTDKEYDSLEFSKINNPSTGTLYELMCLDKISTYFENNKIESIEGIYSSVELRNNENKVINELDIVILLKTGKLIVFEVKSGIITKVENKELVKQQNSYSELVYILCGTTEIVKKEEPIYISEIINKQLKSLETKKIEILLFDEIENYLEKV